MAVELDLAKIRNHLVRLEDSIIISLFERAQYKTDLIVYAKGGIPVPEFEGSYLDFMLHGTEKLHAAAGRYNDPREHHFFDNLPKPIASRSSESENLPQLNYNAKIKKAYLGSISSFCLEGDDREYGSAVLCDIACLQKISERVHYGRYVAESKYRQDQEGFNKLAKISDKVAIRAKLKNGAVEQEILDRVAQKGSRYNVNPEFISLFYKDVIIPMTMDLEVEYILKRAHQSSS
jgi:chorismate mutase